jgi:AraC-like DNA-binding protein
MSEKERQIILDLFSKIQHELDQSIDKHSRKLISANIELLLDYCTRFYDRQFITRDHFFDLEKSVSQVAYDLGFKYPQHFTRLFKQRVGCTPNEYQALK